MNPEMGQITPDRAWSRVRINASMAGFDGATGHEGEKL